MQIRTKILISTSLSVFFSVILLTVGAAWLSIQQTEDTNEKRLLIAQVALKKELLQPILEARETHQQFIKESTAFMNTFAQLVEQKTLKDVKVEIELNPSFAKNLIAYGKSRNVRYAFFSSPSNDLVFQYLIKQNALAVENFTLTAESYNVDVKEIQAPIPFPQVQDILDKAALLSIEGQVYEISDFPLIYPGENRQSGIKKGDEIGHFTFLAPLNLDLKQQGLNMGVQISLYDRKGTIIFGNKGLGNLDAKQLKPSANVVQLKDQGGEKFDSIIQPLSYNESVVGYFSVTISQRITREKALETISLLSLIAIITLVIIGIITFVTITRLTTPLKKVTLLLKDIASGEGDLTQRLSFSGKDEIGQLSHWFNLFVEKLQTLIQEIQSDSESLATSSEELSYNATEIKTTSADISKLILNESTSISESHQTIEVMVKALQSMFERIKEIQSEAGQSENTAVQGIDTIKAMNEKMGKIEQSSQKIEGVIDVITNISSQTNLLSLNAAIEAAKAGEQGKGFAVVAAEVRSLATKSHSSVAEISKLIEASKTSVREGSEGIQQTHELLDFIINQVRQIATKLNGLTSNISSLEERTNEVSQTIEEISEASESNSSAVMQLSQAIEESNHTTDGLRQLAEELSDKVKRFKVQ